MNDGFPDNWTYLRTELNWLDRVLAGAIARQRKEKKDVDRVSKARIDQITSHWWKGLIQVDGAIAADSPAQMPQSGSTKVSYQQQLDARIEASLRRGITLGLPSLCQHLELSSFEKNVMLLALAPEVSRRYGRIYNFLQETEHPSASGLPTIDLILRLLCRNDIEWRTARQSLSHQSRLLQYGLVVLPPSATEPFLSHPVKLADAIAEYLLADAPQLSQLDSLLQTKALPVEVLPVEVERPAPAHSPLAAPLNPEPLLDYHAVQSLTAIAHLPQPTTDLWQTLVLPDRLLADLRHLSDRVRYAAHIDANWGFQAHCQHQPSPNGTFTLFVGTTGTGKTLAAQAIAQSLEVPCVCVDLATIDPCQTDSLLQHLLNSVPTVLLLKSAHCWFGRSPAIDAAKLRHFWHERCAAQTLTLLSVESASQIKATWRAATTHTLTFPVPGPAQRSQLWQQAFPRATPLANDIDWQKLAKRVLTGGQIQAIAREAAVYAIVEAETSHQIGMKHLLQACEHFDISFKAKRRSR